MRFLGSKHTLRFFSGASAWYASFLSCLTLRFADYNCFLLGTL
uniref:Lipoprotein n=1 Tax=Siphoviridae sp. ctJ0s2 TaxID=2827834 RepID=A0A8S5TE76_9CAUD|nr:MAG TPA: hypothetical protein [Siphoviridae sp. ctJ0s2]